MRKLTLDDLAASGIGPVYVPVVAGELTDSGGDGAEAVGHRPHAVPEVLCILQGRGVLQVNGNAVPFASGDVFIIEPGEEHRLVNHSDMPLVHAWLHLHEE